MSGWFGSYTADFFAYSSSNARNASWSGPLCARLLKLLQDERAVLLLRAQIAFDACQILVVEILDTEIRLRRCKLELTALLAPDQQAELDRYLHGRD